MDRFTASDSQFGRKCILCVYEVKSVKELTTCFQEVLLNNNTIQCNSKSLKRTLFGFPNVLMLFSTKNTTGTTILAPDMANTNYLTQMDSNPLHFQQCFSSIRLSKLNV